MSLIALVLVDNIQLRKHDHSQLSPFPKFSSSDRSTVLHVQVHDPGLLEYGKSTFLSNGLSTTFDAPSKEMGFKIRALLLLYCNILSTRLRPWHDVLGHLGSNQSGA